LICIVLLSEMGSSIAGSIVVYYGWPSANVSNTSGRVPAGSFGKGQQPYT